MMSSIWDAYPMSDVVWWPKDEKIIGVVGVASMATADFFMKLCSTHAEKEWQRPRILVDSNPKIPSRGRYFELGETDPAPFIRASIDNLLAQGATVIGVPCNTAHIFYERYAYGIEAFVPSIIDVTVDACVKKNVKKALILASRATVSHRLYQNALECRNIEALVPDDAAQNLASAGIEAVKQYGHDARLARELSDVARQSGADATILGCTELPVLMRTEETSAGTMFINSSAELAKYCLDAAKGTEKPKYAGNES